MVSKCSQKSTGGKYAVKSISKKGLQAEDLSEIESEFDIQATISHPNVVQVYRMYNTPDYVYISMYNPCLLL